MYSSLALVLGFKNSRFHIEVKVDCLSKCTKDFDFEESGRERTRVYCQAKQASGIICLHQVPPTKIQNGSFIQLITGSANNLEMHVKGDKGDKRTLGEISSRIIHIFF